MTEYIKPLATIDMQEYVDMKKKIAEAEDLKMHREAIAAMLNAMFQVFGMGDNRAAEIVKRTNQMLSAKKIDFFATRYAGTQVDSKEPFREEGININRTEKTNP